VVDAREALRPRDEVAAVRVPRALEQERHGSVVLREPRLEATRAEARAKTLHELDVFEGLKDGEPAHRWPFAAARAE
jgi:hypothetical protein